MTTASFLIILAASLTCWVQAIPIDNGVEGDPEIECGATGITVNFNVRNNFEGHVYVKGRFAEAGCRSDEAGRKVAGIQLPFTACGTERARSLNPRGVFVRQTVVVSFHPQFLTKVDRAYTIQCFYMEADKTVSQELEVSEITTQFQSQQVPMPVCRYDILDNGPTGQPIKFALIGQQVYHKWTCDTETTDIFCMVVHSCSVDDGAGNRVTLLNEAGCGLDKHLLQNLDYTTDLMAGKESHVFKYADKAALFFQCQISISIKEPGAQCVRPQCPEPGGPGSAPGVGGVGAGTAGGAGTLPPARPVALGAAGTPAPAAHPATVGPAAPAATAAPAGTPAPAAAATPAGRKAKGRAAALRFFRNRRSVADELGVIDVRAQPITTLDIDFEDDIPKWNSSIRSAVTPKIQNSPRLMTFASESYCLSPLLTGLLIVVTAVTTLSAIIVATILVTRKSQKH